MDFFKRWFFLKISFCKIKKEIYFNKGYFFFLIWILINGLGIVGNNIIDFYNIYGRIYES